ncbi:GumC family protein [Ferrimonas senticii]|uniref:GumC family protein n=1 Tax=Ferrimonas senticii TaxID=394566 RepID=UPI00040990AB|nr:polysaccharide biosynthesis tyrosine autokinase [Ferrimonas senticii]
MALKVDTDLFAHEKDIDLGHYLLVLWRYKWRIGSFVMLMAALAVAVLVNIAPQYVASGRLMIESEQAKAVSIEDVYGLDSGNKDYLQTQFEIIKSRRLAEQVIERLNLTVHPEFLPKPPPRWKTWLLSHVDTAPNQDPMEVVRGSLQPYFGWLPLNWNPAPADPAADLERRRVKLLYEFSRRLVVSPVPNTQLVDIGFYAHSPQLAALVANTMGDVYIDNHLDAKLNVTRKASEWLSARLDELQQGLRLSEERLQRFKEDNQLLEIDGTVGLVSREMSELTAQLAAARQRRDDARSLLNVVRRRGADSLDDINGISEISGHRLIQEMQKSEVTAAANVAELSKRYGPKHNKMIAARAQLAEVRSTMRSQVRKLVSGIEQEYQTLNASTIALEQQLERAKGQYQEQSRVEVQFRELQREVESNRRIYETFLNRMKETGAVADFNAAHARFTDVAEPPLYPAKPNKKMLLLLTVVGSFVLACVVALAHNALTDTITSGDQVEAKLSSKLLGVIPLQKIKKDQRLSAQLFFSEQAASFSEAWRTVRTSYLMSHLDDGAKRICVTSTVPGEGKSTSSYNLALALSQLEKVLLIEADLRKPVLAASLKLPSYQPGLANLISGTHNDHDCIIGVPDTDLDVMVAGTAVANPLELLSSEPFKAHLMRLSQQYDRIIIDTAPVDVVSDALVVSPLVDSIIYVVKYGKARRELIRRSLARLFALHAKVDGVVLNGLPRQESSYKRYKSYYGNTRNA